MASRLGATIAIGAGLGKLVARSSLEYEAIALRLATDAAFLSQCKEAARSARVTPAFDLAGRVRALESAFEAMVARQRAGLAPASLEIP